MKKAYKQEKTKRKKLIKGLAFFAIMFSLFTFFAPTGFADDDTSDSNANIAEISEAASAKNIYNKDDSDPQGDQQTNTGAQYPGLKAVAPSWSFLGLNTKSGILKKGDADTATVPLKSLIIYKADKNGDDTGETSMSTVKAAELPAVLQINGLDTVKADSILSKIGRFIGGALIMVALALTFIANIVIIFALWLIKSLNPLVIMQALMANSGFAVIKIPTTWGNLPVIGNLLEANNPFGAVINTVLSWSVPILVIMLLGIFITLLFWLPYTRRSGVRGTLMNGITFALKRLAIVIILPSIAGSIFLAAFSLSSNGMQAPMAATKGLLQSTFVQFGAWSDRTRLFIPDPAAFTGFKQTPLKANLPSANTKDAALKWTYNTPKRVPILPNYILAINTFGARDVDAVQQYNASGSALSGPSGSATDATADNQTSKVPTAGPDATALKKEVSNLTNVGNSFSIVRQWMSSDTYSATSYAGTIESQYNAGKDDKNQTLTQANEIKKDVQDPKDVDKGFVSGYLQVSQNAIRYTDAKGYFSDTNVGAVPAAESVEPLIKGTSAGLSPIGMWNYLNSRIKDGTLVQQDPRKTQDKTSIAHAMVVLPGGIMIGSLSLGVVIAFVAAAIVPTLAIASILIKYATEGFLGWQHILGAFSGSIKSWIHIGQLALKILMTMFMLGFVGMIAPSFANFIITSVDAITAATDSTFVFGIGKLIEIILLILIAWGMIKAFTHMGDLIGSIAPGVKGDNFDKAKSIFDRGSANAVDDMTRGSSNKLAKMVNEANEKDVRDHKDMATDRNGNAMRNADGKFGLNDDKVIDPETGQESLGRLNTLPNAISDSAKDALKDLKARAMTNTDAENQAEKSRLTSDLADAESELEKLGLGIPESQYDNAVEAVNSLIGDNNALATPEVLDAAKRIQDSTQGLAALEDLEKENNFKAKADNFASTLGKDINGFANATLAGKALSGMKNAAGNYGKSVDEKAAELAQLKDLAEGKPTDDSIYGAMTDEQKAQLEKESSLDAISVNPTDVAKNISNLKKVAPKQAQEIKSELDDINKTLNKTSADLNEKIDDEIGLSQTPGISTLAEDELLKAAIPEAIKNGADPDDMPADVYMDYKNRLANEILAFDHAKTTVDPYDLGKDAYVKQRLASYLDDPNNTLTPRNKEGVIDDIAAKQAHEKYNAVAQSAYQNYDRTFNAMQQGLQVAFDNIPSGGERLQTLRDASSAHENFINTQRSEFFEKNPNVYNDPNYAQFAEDSIHQNLMANQPRNYGLFYSDVKSRIEKGQPRESALLDAYKHATSRQDEYHMVPRAFNTASELITGTNSSAYRASRMKNLETNKVLGVKQAQLSQKLQALDTSTPMAAAYSAGVQDFNNRTTANLPQLKRYMKPNNGSVPVGKIMDPLSNYTNLYKTHQNQKPVTGNAFTKVEMADREKVENVLTRMRTDLENMGVSHHVLTNSQLTSQMYNELTDVRETYGNRYREMAPKADKI